MKNLIFLLFLGLAFMQCSAITKVYSETEPGVNLFKYRSYVWAAEDASNNGSPGNALLQQKTDEKIRATADTYMASHRYVLCQDAPDLKLHYHIVLENKVYYQREWQCNDEDRKSYGYCYRVKPVYFKEGTLIIDFTDARTGNQVWRGVAVGVLEKTTDAEREKLIEEAVMKIFKKFPASK